MLKQRTIAANTSFYAIALTVQKTLSFIYFSYLARSLGTELTGKYFFALSIAAIATAAIDLGFTPVLTREAARERERSSEILSHIVIFKIFLALLVAAVMFIAIPLVIPETILRHLLYIAVGIALADSFALSFFATIRAHQNLVYESMAAILFQVLVLIIGGAAIYSGADVRLITSVLLIASIINLAFAYLVLRRHKVRLTLSVNPALAKQLIRFAVPFAVATIFIKVYAYLDTVMLKFLVSDAAVGVYSVAYKITFAFQFIPMAMVAALYPVFSYSFQHAKEGLTSTFAKSLDYLTIISIPIVAGIVAIAQEVVPDIYTAAYRGSILPLIILISSLPFLFLNFPVGSLLNATNRQTRQMVHLGITMVVNIILNIILIPALGPLGAAIASTASTVFIFFLGIIVAHRIAPFDVSAFLRTSVKLLFIAGTMLVLVMLMKRTVPWYLAIIPAIVWYAIGLQLFKIVTLKDFVDFKAMLRQ